MVLKGKFYDTKATNIEILKERIVKAQYYKNKNDVECHEWIGTQGQHFLLTSTLKIHPTFVIYFKNYNHAS